ncbi:MAG: 7-carboxy-7-deazaguanine synthase QueE [Fischerella sp.]|nr:7-carboxy-7-deazaguanine synthase QueE [Fischerella sp.]
MQKIKVSEIFYSVQGEGRFIGVPSVFLRTFGCNFTCSGFGCAPGVKSTEADEVAANIHLYKSFEELPLVHTGCDSYASWHPAFKDFSKNYTTAELVEQMLNLVPGSNWLQYNGNDVHLVITGGEPLLGWQRAYEELLLHPRMQSLSNLTFETNGTQPLQDKFKSYLAECWRDHPLRGRNNLTFSVSPKLSASGEAWEDAVCPDVVDEYQYYGFTYLKFVVETEQHFAEVDRAVYEYRNRGFRGPVYVMPQGGVVVPYDKNRVNVADWALKRGYYYSPRLQVDLWQNGWGR